jgi:hypothetical protein
LVLRLGANRSYRGRIPDRRMLDRSLSGFASDLGMVNGN